MISKSKKAGNSKPPQAADLCGVSQEGEAEGQPGRSSAAWDGSQAEIVAEDSAQYEEQHTGIQISYVLEEKEIYECLKKNSYLRTTGPVFIFGIVVLAVLAVVFLILGTVTYRSLFYFYAASCATLIVLLGFFPIQNNRSRAKNSADGHTIRMIIYPDHIQMGRGIKRWEVPLDGSVEFAQFEDLIMLFVKEKDDPKGKLMQKMIILPLRCIKPAVLPEVRAMLVAGTKPKKMPKAG